MDGISVRRLLPGDEAATAAMVAMMNAVFDEPSEPLSADYVAAILRRDSFWAIAAFDGTEVVGGLTAHTLPMTRSPASEIFIYDLAVRTDLQRQGVGSRLMQQLAAAAARQGISEIFVPADNEDTGALEFYLAQGSTPSPVTIFTLPPRPPRASGTVIE